MEDETKKEFEKTRKNVNSFAKFSGLGFQMLGMLLLGVWGGLWLDGKLGFKVPVMTIILSLTGLFGSMYLLYKEVTNTYKDDNKK